MQTRIQKWGNSQGLRLPKQMLEDASLAVGDPVDVSTREGVIVIIPTKPKRSAVRLEDLVARIPKGYKAAEVDWGKPVGKEAW